MAEINIPSQLMKKIKEKAEKTGFASVEDYILYILKQVVSDENSSSEKRAYSKEEEEALKSNLKEMGYL